MMNLWLATSTDSSWNAWMGSGGVSIHVYSHIQLIIPKSESMIYLHCVMLAETIKQSSPCNHQKQWELSLSSLSGKKGGHFETGTSQGHANRLSCARSYVGDLITRARDFIYKLGLNVAGAAVECLLLEHSWVPTAVRYPPIHWLIA
jgi:hypothetical protein